MNKTDAHVDPARHVGRLINTISHQLKRNTCAHEEEDDLTNIQRLVLHYILFQSLKGDVYQKDVEREFQIRRSTVTGIVQLLEKNGFITRESVKWDARLKKVVPTEKAEKVRKHIFENIERVESILKRGISEDELAVCLDVLERMSKNLSGNEKKIRGEETAKHE